jgi:hypothetical protein
MFRRVLLFAVYLTITLVLLAVQGEIIADVALVAGRGWAVVPFVVTMLGWTGYFSRAFPRMGKPRSLAWAVLLPFVNIPIIVVGLWWLSGHRLGIREGESSG